MIYARYALLILAIILMIVGVIITANDDKDPDGPWAIAYSLGCIAVLEFLFLGETGPWL